MVIRIIFLAIVKSIPFSRKLQAESSASVPSLTIQVTKGECWNCRTGNAKSWICAFTDCRTRIVYTLTSSGVGASGGGSLAQLEIASTGLNLRSESGRYNPIVALGKE